MRLNSIQGALQTEEIGAYTSACAPKFKVRLTTSDYGILLIME